MHRTTFFSSLCLVLLAASAASAQQELSSSERTSALSRVRSMEACLERHHEQLEQLLRLVGESEQQRRRSSDPAARRDAERAIDALIARAATIQREARGCVGGDELPSPGATVVEQPPPPDPAASAVAESGGTVPAVERDARLTGQITVVRGEKVDGHGQLDDAVVREAIRAIGPRLDRCYERYLDRGAFGARHLDLLFTFRGRGRARAVSVERSEFHDERFERCVRAAAQRLRVGTAPRGGEAAYSYRLRFGQATAGPRPLVDTSSR